MQQGLTDPISGLIMGCTAENIAREFSFLLFEFISLYVVGCYFLVFLGILKRFVLSIQSHLSHVWGQDRITSSISQRNQVFLLAQTQFFFPLIHFKLSILNFSDEPLHDEHFSLDHRERGRCFESQLEWTWVWWTTQRPVPFFGYKHQSKSIFGEQQQLLLSSTTVPIAIVA